MEKIDLSIIIVNYNTAELIKNLLDSIKKAKINGYKIETIVVDNASFDNSRAIIRKEFPWVNLIKNKQNSGYAKANNKGMKSAIGRYILFLNSDTLLQKDTLTKILEFMDKNQDYGALTSKVVLADNKIDPACHRGFPTPWAAFTYFSGLENFFPQSRLFGQYHQTWKNLNQTHEIEVISGAFFLIRKEALDKVGLFDERFFMYAEDIDLCYRLKEKGFKIIFYPETKIIHFKKSSGRKKNKSKKITLQDRLIRKKSKEYFFKTMKLFYDKHYKNKYLWLTRWLVLRGIKLISLFKN